MSIDPNNYLKNLDDEQLQQLQQQLDDETVRKLQDAMDPEIAREIMLEGLVEQLAPIAQGIRDRRASQDSPEEIRRQLRRKSPAEKQDLMDKAILSVVEAIWTLREDVDEGIPMVQSLIRDPYTVEALLLTFEHPDHIDPEYAREMKQLWREVLTWIGVALAPGMYEPETVERVGQTLDIDVERRE